MRPSSVPTQKMQVDGSSETSLPFYRTAWRRTLEGLNDDEKYMEWLIIFVGRVAQSV